MHTRTQTQAQHEKIATADVIKLLMSGAMGSC